MDFVLGFPLIFLLLSSGHTHTMPTEHSTNRCYAMCPAGYYKLEECTNSAAKMYRCRKCDKNTFTEHENYVSFCMRCKSCDNLEVEIQACNITSNTVCDCKEGYYIKEYHFDGNEYSRTCTACPPSDGPKNNSDYKKKCQSDKGKESPAAPTTLSNTTQHPVLSPPYNLEGEIQPCNITSNTVCDCGEGYYIKEDHFNGNEYSRTCTACPPSDGPKNNSDYKKKCQSDKGKESPAAPTTLSNTTQHPVLSQPYMMSRFWLLCMAVVICVGGLLLLLLITIINLGKPNSIPCWSTNKGVEEQKINLNELHSHQCSSPTTRTFHVSEEPVDGTYLLPSAEREARKQDNHSEHLPAIVLYAIIKEVPLRRWKEFLRLLSVADQQLERVELETGLGLSSMEKQYQMLRLWSQQSNASLSDIFSTLQYMDLSGCAQLLQENLEKLEWSPE